MNVLVTGGAGFIGSHIVHALVERGDSARVLDDLSGGSRENLAGLDVGEPGSGAAVELIVGDVSDAAAAAQACREVLDAHNFDPDPTLTDLTRLDQWAREETSRWTSSPSIPGTTSPTG